MITSVMLLFGCSAAASATENGGTGETPISDVIVDMGDIFSDFDSKKTLLGDSNSDDVVDSADALSVLRKSVSLDEYTPDIIPVADVDGDENITSADALDILRFSASLSANERIGQPI